MSGGRRSAALAKAALASLLLAGQPSAQEAPPPAQATISAAVAAYPTVRIGVRVDAMPFAWREQRPEENRPDRSEPHQIFRGFLVDLCSKAAIHARYKPELIPVTAKERKAFLSGIEPDKEGADNFDILCDPTTVSLARMYMISEDERFLFSPIIFVANNSYVTPNPIELEDAKKRDSLAGAGSVDASQTASCAGYVTGTTAEDAIRAAAALGKLGGSGTEYCSNPYDSHRDGMEAICSGRIGYYFGDIDIISAYEKEINALPGKSCALVYHRDFLIYEPYALLVGRGENGFRQKFIRELYRLFSDGTVQETFEAYFPERRSSDALSMLFRINGIPFGSLVEGQPDPAPETAPPAPSVDPSAAPAVSGAPALGPLQATAANP